MAKPKAFDPRDHIVRDETYPTMWRVRYRDGNVSDMVNRTRAVDAARALYEQGKIGE